MGDYKTGAELLKGAGSREVRLELAVKALMAELESGHVAYHGQSLADNIDNPSVYCSCADAYRMGAEALKAA